MRPVGRPSENLNEKDIKMTEEYLSTDITLDAISEKYKMPKSTVRYKINKYRREIEKEKNNE